MNRDTLYRRLVETSVYDMNIHSPLGSNNGWKISIQGKTVGDSMYLYNNLHELLMGMDVPFKVATVNRYALRNNHPEQSYKAMTIYCPDGIDFNDLCEEVYSKVIDYKGWQNIKTPNGYEHYAGGLFVRCDRDVNGHYIPASSVQ